MYEIRNEMIEIGKLLVAGTCGFHGQVIPMNGKRMVESCIATMEFMSQAIRQDIKITTY